MDEGRAKLNALIVEADRVVADYGRYLEASEELVDGIPERRAALERRLAPFRERLDAANEETQRARRDHGFDSPEWDSALKAQDRADSALYHAGRGFGGDDFDVVNRKAVARHLVSLAKEDTERRLDVIAARDGNAGLRAAVAERKDEVFRSAHYLLTRRFADERGVQSEEVRTTRAEANDIFERLKHGSDSP